MVNLDSLSPSQIAKISYLVRFEGASFDKAKDITLNDKLKYNLEPLLNIVTKNLLLYNSTLDSLLDIVVKVKNEYSNYILSKEAKDIGEFNKVEDPSLSIEELSTYMLVINPYLTKKEGSFSFISYSSFIISNELLEAYKNRFMR